jgi:GT2 family glycosyltransferase/lipopolysaccharide/colanic/teichoic acid biosynthesis glycosyltransferase
MDLSVIIVNYNVRDFLNNALVSISKALQGLDSEIFVVDNASDDGSGDFIRKHFPAVHLIENRRNIGFAAANNIALTKAAGKYIVLVNPDTLVQEDTFQTLLDAFKTFPDAGMIGCKILNPDGTLQLACRRSFPTPWVAFTKIIGLSTLFPNSHLFARYNLSYLDPEKSYEVDAVSGSFMMIRREVYEQIGGLDENFFMYGEDLDWCYRVQKAGWKVRYVPLTQIIHYKGESTRRSDIDELKLFYSAMSLFVRKHHTRTLVFTLFLETGILLRSMIAFVARIIRQLVVAAVDTVIVCGTILCSGYFYRGHIGFPEYAYPWVFLVPSLTVILTLYVMGLYSNKRLSVSRSMLAVITSYIVIAALTAFFKTFAFSRVMVLISGGFSLVCIPGWRLIVRLRGIRGTPSQKTLFGRRTLIVGTGEAGQQVLKKLRNRPGEGYSVVGVIDSNRQRVGEHVGGVEILGSVDTIGKVIDEYRISEVIFSADAVSYTSILSIIGKTRNKSVNFRMVPTSMEVIIGKASIDQLDDIPFIDIEYNIHRTLNRIAKRTVDIAVALIFLIWFWPFVYLFRLTSNRTSGAFTRAIMLMPKIFSGSMSLIGRTTDPDVTRNENLTGIYLGKPGLTGMVQIHADDPLSSEEREQYELYYAKNQSFMLDVEIVIKSLIRWLGKNGS